MSLLMLLEDKQRIRIRKMDKYLWECKLCMKNYHWHLDHLLNTMDRLNKRGRHRVNYLKDYQKLKKRQVLCRYWDARLARYTKLYKKLKDNPL